MIEPLLIRADASAQIGSGHVMRCIALAQQWQRRGGAVTFACAELSPALELRLKQMGVTTIALKAERGAAKDASDTAELALELGCKWVVADGYEFQFAWQSAVRTAGLKLLVLDDHAHADRYAADIVLNQNLSANPELYSRKEPDTHLLLGTRFTLIREEFRQAPMKQDFPEQANRVLVTLGGSDPDNVTGLVLDSLKAFSGLEVVIVVGGSNPHASQLREQCAQAAGNSIRLVVDAKNMSELMEHADVAITAAGSTSWELACMGLPALQLVIAENQLGIAAALNAAGITKNLGDFRHTTAARIAEELKALLANPGRRQEMSKRALQLLDGHGSARVAAALGAPLSLTLLSDAESWINSHLETLRHSLRKAGHQVRWIHQPNDLEAGDIAFFLSLSRVVPQRLLRLNAHNLVVHESALPKGRGWSPLTWQVLEGKSEIPVTLLEAAEGVDAGEIHAQRAIRLRGDELVDELRQAQARTTLELCQAFVAGYPFHLDRACAQEGEPSFYPRRRPVDSRLDPDQSLRSQFNLLRVCDPDRYPAYFEMNGCRYEVRLSKRPL